MIELPANWPLLLAGGALLLLALAAHITARIIGQ